MHDAALHHTVAAAIDWWRLAGVDQDYGAAKGWLREAQAPAPALTDAPTAPPVAKPATPKPQAPPPPALGGPQADWPTDLTQFRDWWLTQPTLGPATDRVPSHGPSGAALMVLVPQPQAKDAASGQLLSGEQGALVSAMLRAMGVAPDQAAVLALLPRRAAMSSTNSRARRAPPPRWSPRKCRCSPTPG